MKITIFHISTLLLIVLLVASTFFFGPQHTLVIAASIVLVPFFLSILILDKLIPRLKMAGLTGKDENKEGNPNVAEMGGIAVVAAFTAGALLATSLYAFDGFHTFNLTFMLAAIITIQAITIVGLVDDVLSVPQWLKAILPIFAAVPLIAVNAVAKTSLAIPFIGVIDFGLFYVFVLVPLAIAVCSNLTNMLAGFNGLETGLGVIIFATLSLLAWQAGSWQMLLISLPMLGALLGFLYFNWYPAKVFPGDTATFMIGGALATAVIVGNFETAGAILMVPFILDFIIKALNRFPHTYSELKNGKLYPKDGKAKGLVHVVMNAFGGISERNLTLFFMGTEAVFALIALALFLKH